MSDGTRKVVAVSEIVGMEGDVITAQDIFIFERTGINEKGAVLGHHRTTGIRPKCAERLKLAGIDLPVELFAEWSEA
jgi:pilus assembly protein CpaF